MSSPQLQEIARVFARRGGEPMALATLVRTTGSSYLRPGARLLITANGERFGALSAGCIEEEVSERARAVIESGESCLMKFDTRLRFGCHGTLEIFVERIERANGFLTALADCFQNRKSFVGVTVFASGDSSRLGSRTACHPERSEAQRNAVEGSREITCGAPAAASSPEFSRDPSTSLRFARDDGAPFLAALDSHSTALIHPIAPPVHLLIGGAGTDSEPLRRGAEALGWKVSVIAHPGESEDGSADSLRCDPDQLPFVIPVDSWTVAVVKTHHYGRDFTFLRALLPLRLKYVGLLGARRRREQLVAELLEAGIALDAFDSLHAPAGIDAGAESPEEIALSIVAEIQTVLAGRPHHSLRDGKEPIHAREEPNLRAVGSR